MKKKTEGSMFLLHPRTTKPHHCLSESKLTHCFVWEKEQTHLQSLYFSLVGDWKVTVFFFLISSIYMCVCIGEGREMRKDCRRVSKMKGRISKIGSYAISSSIRDQQQQQQPCITCTTFNILAPIYKRLNHEVPFLLYLICSWNLHVFQWLLDACFYVLYLIWYSHFLEHSMFNCFCG